MKSFISGFLVLFVCCLFAGDIVTKSGTVYKSAEIERATERGLLILHETGAAVVPYSNLPDDLQKKYQADAERFEAAKKAARTARQSQPKQVPDFQKSHVSSKSAIDKRYWQTASSKKIHNAVCRDYQKGAGEMVSDLNGGTNCKICGGMATSEKSMDKAKAPTSETSTEYNGARTIHTGPRGGRYYINKNGNKTYIRRKK